MKLVPQKLLDNAVIARLSREKPAPTPKGRRATPANAPAPAVDEPVDDNFYFETCVTSPATQLSVWELVNDEHEPGGPVDNDALDDAVLVAGHTATVAFWTSKRGQELIRSFDDGPQARALGNWLAETLPNLYGADGQSLGGRTNKYLAGIIRRDARAPEPRLEAQALALALAIYATREFLGGPQAEPLGFRVSPLGVAPCIANVGPLGAPFQAANGSALTILQLLLALDAQAVSGVPLAGKETLRQQAHDLLDLLNRFGGIDA